jgi:hypothetical protein
MPEQHRRLIEAADQLLVVVDSLLDARSGRRRGGLAYFLDVAVLARPLGR